MKIATLDTISNSRRKDEKNNGLSMDHCGILQQKGRHSEVQPPHVTYCVRNNRQLLSGDE